MIEVEEKDLLSLIYFSRRYCDGRATYAPSLFNDIYKRIRSAQPEFLRSGDKFDSTLKDKGNYWPYAQDGWFNKDTGDCDARK